MYCKYCGKKLDGAMEVCTECEEKLLKGENPFFSVPVYRDPVKQLKQSLAAQNTPEQVSASNEQPGVQPEQNIVEGEQPPVEAEQSAVQPEQNVVNQIRSPETRTYLGNQSQLPQQKKDFYGNDTTNRPIPRLRRIRAGRALRSAFCRSFFPGRDGLPLFLRFSLFSIPVTATDRRELSRFFPF